MLTARFGFFHSVLKSLIRLTMLVSYLRVQPRTRAHMVQCVCVCVCVIDTAVNNNTDIYSGVPIYRNKRAISEDSKPMP